MGYREKNRFVLVLSDSVGCRVQTLLVGVKSGREFKLIALVQSDVVTKSMMSLAPDCLSITKDDVHNQPRLDNTDSNIAICVESFSTRWPFESLP